MKPYAVKAVVSVVSLGLLALGAAFVFAGAETGLQGTLITARCSRAHHEIRYRVPHDTPPLTTMAAAFARLETAGLVGLA